MDLIWNRIRPAFGSGRVRSNLKGHARPYSPAYPHAIRGQRVVLDSDLAALYGVPTKRLNEAVRRNADRSPTDFCFQLTAEESAGLRSKIAALVSQGPSNQPVGSNWSQFATSSRKHRGATHRPWAFTEHGALMAATMLNSHRAVQMSLFIVRAFVRMRDEMLANAVILRRLAAIERKLLEHDVVEKLLPLLSPPEDPPRPRIGFHPATR